MDYNLHIFVNSVEFIAKVIDLAKLAPEQVKTVCSTSGDNAEVNRRKLGKAYAIGQPSDPVRKINFYTSTCFEGCDLYDENGVTFIVSDGNKSHTLLDISTLFTQICGRLRNSKYKGEIIHVYSTTKYSREVTLDEFVASTKSVLAEAEQYAADINALPEKSRIKTLSKIPYINEQYVRIEDCRLVVDKNLANMDIVNFKICRHIYRTYVNLTSELQRNGYTITRHTFSEIIEKIESNANARVTFKELFDEYRRLKTTRPFFSLDNHEELCARIAIKYPLVKQAYDELGTAKVQALKYHVGNIRRELTKTLDRRAAEIFRSMLALQTTKIDNSDGTYMPVYLELIGRIDKYDFFSLAHYGQQNGDAMRDPEMLFALHKDTRQFIPYYYRNDYCGIEENSVRWSEDGIALNPRLQASHTTFANQWLRNIAAQQGIQ